MRTLLLLSFACLLTACADSTPSVKGADPCAKPQVIPQGWLNDAQIETLWLKDRNELMKCGDKVETLSGRRPDP